MKQVTFLMLWIAVAVGVSSCGKLTPAPKPTSKAPPIPAQFRGGPGGGAEITQISLDNPEAAAAASDGMAKRDEGLVFLDPDNPEAGLEELSEVMSASARKGPWEISFIAAKQTAMREGKPMLVWFTDSEKSILCRYLSAEVFGREDFKKWAEKDVVRVRLDFNVEGVSRGPDHTAEDDRIRKEDYLEKLKKRYKVLGLPSVLIMAPDGTVVGNYRGYTKTYSDFYLARLEKAAGVAESHHQKWVKKMEKRGYRVWTDEDGRTLFAKLQLYRDRNLILVEPDGKRIRARESTLSEADQAWIKSEKAKRERP